VKRFVAILLLAGTGCRAPQALFERTSFAVGQRYEIAVPYALINDRIKSFFALTSFQGSGYLQVSQEAYQRDPSRYTNVVGVATNRARLTIVKLKPRHIVSWGWSFEIFARIDDGPFANQIAEISSMTETAQGFTPDTKILSRIDDKRPSEK
jgi:hypothetical protein